MIYDVYRGAVAPCYSVTSICARSVFSFHAVVLSLINELFTAWENGCVAWECQCIITCELKFFMHYRTFACGILIPGNRKALWRPHHCTCIHVKILLLNKTFDLWPSRCFPEAHWRDEPDSISSISLLWLILQFVFIIQQLCHTLLPLHFQTQQKYQKLQRDWAELRARGRHNHL